MAVSPCIFCPNPRTNKRGEHVWDNWLNRIGGKEIREPSTTSHYGFGHELIREHRSAQLDVTIPVVCGECNNTWMSDISNRTKAIIEPSVRRDEPRDFYEEDIVTLTAFAFMKSAVIDWSRPKESGKPCISRQMCLSFRSSLTDADSADITLPRGLQVWIARYKRRFTMEAQAFNEEVTDARYLKGYRVLVITYFVGSFMFQLTCPAYRGLPGGKRAAPPSFIAVNDQRAVLIWPDVSFASWPPLTHVDSGSLESFRERFRHVRVPRLS